MFWKILFAFIPPVNWGHGWPAFFVALIFIGSVTAVVAEVATVLGCTIGLKEAVTAITLVAIGTSLPDTFASMTAAKSSEYADSAIGNVTGSNSVNVFLGLGLPWLIATFYEKATNDANYFVPAGSLGFSVVVFIICAIICIITLLIRRKVVGGELGGGKVGRVGSLIFLCFLWCIYILMSIL
jgi:solute carrier family 8 (sodium/calcium exchanger)